MGFKLTTFAHPMRNTSILLVLYIANHCFLSDLCQVSEKKIHHMLSIQAYLYTRTQNSPKLTESEIILRIQIVKLTTQPNRIDKYIQTNLTESIIEINVLHDVHQE